MEMTSLEPEARRDERIRSSQTGCEDSFLSRSVSRARASSCPNCQGFFLVSRGGAAFRPAARLRVVGSDDPDDDAGAGVLAAQ